MSKAAIPGFLHSISSLIQGIFHFGIDAAKNFFNDNCYEKASALAFYSALSLVPVLAVMFGIAQGFGLGKNLESTISDQFFHQTEVRDKLIQFAHSWLQNVEGGLIAGIGTLILLWSVISLMISVENSLNSIWKIKIGRSFIHKIRDYLMVIFIAPLIFVAASSMNVYLITKLTQSAQEYDFVETVTPFLLYFLNLFPLFLIWILFTFIYAFIPNTKVYLREALIAGVIAGTAFQFWQWIYIKFQLNVSSYNAVYGSFAALPLFLIWLQVSWMIVLIGAEIAAEIENGFFMRHKSCRTLSSKTAALLVVQSCLDAFAKGAPPLTDFALKRSLGIPLDYIHPLLDILTKERILSAVSINDTTVAYQPARSLQSITYLMVSDALDKSHVIPTYAPDSPALKKIEALIASMNKAGEDSLGHQSLYALMQAS